ncbi:hypothetical protein MAR_017776 [Mya arenaria]|uniref:Uncharacterized protein n=1 Tax=Mya arenaria TaxID=6604 RepID=A0ABY7ECT0_MYAAR|nr:hypothetical protein MAR_017776 [Mya arenaria]
MSIVLLAVSHTFMRETLSAYLRQAAELAAGSWRGGVVCTFEADDKAGSTVRVHTDVEIKPEARVPLRADRQRGTRSCVHEGAALHGVCTYHHDPVMLTHVHMVNGYMETVTAEERQFQ